MKREDYDFLVELQHELNTQEHDCQAAPRYWGIEEYVWVLAHDGEGEPFVHDSSACRLMTLQEFVEDISEDLEESEDKELIESWGEINKNNAEDVVDFANNTIRESEECEVIWQRKELQVSEQTSCFLTKRAAKRHLEQNWYHYNNGHTYAMTAWRNPEFERCMELFQKADLTKLLALIED